MLSKKQGTFIGPPVILQKYLNGLKRMGKKLKGETRLP